ncbi:hypothetical protein HN011_005352 [Eciton burchellii]|nr:hypothetical protein HN011_005352 [Eciton burchellii]
MRALTSRKWHLSAPPKVMETYDDCKKKLIFPRTIMCSQNFTMAGKSKRMVSNLDVKNSPGAHRKDRKKRTVSQATFIAPQN